MPEVQQDQYDVAILGGGLAGLTLGLQLKKARPETSVLIAEKRKGPAPEAAFKVGESTVEMSAHYFSDVVGMKDHLQSEQVEKAGLRFFFPADDNRDISKRVEWGPVALPPVPAYQLDRGRFENALGERNLETGVDLLDDCTVQDVELGGDRHVVAMTRGGEQRTVSARWVVDATGYVGLLKRKLGLARDVDHTINSSWFRLAGGIDIEDWSDDEAWLGRLEERGVRKLSTNHLMGEGYWVWLIPLASGPISLGIVADPRFHPWEEINTLDGAIDWLKRHEPQLGEVVDSRRDQVEDFLKVEDFAYGCQRVFSPDRWALTGISGVFLDPFYSPGSDFIAQANTCITEMVVRDFAGERINRLALAYDLAFLQRFERSVRGTYLDMYQLWGDAEVKTAKLLWEFGVYWAAVVLPFMNGRLQDLDFWGTVSGDFGRMVAVADRMEQLWRDWHALGQRERQGAFISNSSFPELWRLHTDLGERYDDETLRAKFSANADLLEAVAVVIFHKAAQRLPEPPDPEAKVNPAAIGLDPDKWEQDGMFDGSGLTLSEAKEKTPGIERMLLDELVQPA